MAKRLQLPKYPEACPFSDEEMDEKISFWKALFAMAKSRGMEVFMQTWNIHLHEKIAKEEGSSCTGKIILSSAITCGRRSRS
ncbi:hypothetical protein [Paenibacillus periandrae]|uniref:hypothetical protein n=1 Tax=Paenibacillus periandrae TaxID=1761741 RepID=UPI001F08F2D2|nr:hypothetical protein [Paenibacillus periandrae]